MIEAFKITKKESFIGKHEETSSTCKEAQNQGVDENPRELKQPIVNLREISLPGSSLWAEAISMGVQRESWTNL